MKVLENIIDSRRIQPYKALDGDYITLVDFAHGVFPLLHPGVKPKKEWSEKKSERTSNRVEKTTFGYGDDENGMSITYLKEYSPKGESHEVDDVIISCYGTGKGTELELRVLRHYNNPRFVEIKATGPKDVISSVFDKFEKYFRKKDSIETDDKQMYLQLVRAAARVHAWRAVEHNAFQYLELNPNNPEALMYLGIAKAVQGFEPEGEHLLLSSLTLDPKNHDAYYNLGVLVMNQGRLLLARDCFNKGLEMEPTNHPLLYQLGQVLERLEDFGGALNAYQEALDNSPDSDYFWECGGIIFTNEAQDAIKQIKTKSGAEI